MPRTSSIRSVAHGCRSLLVLAACFALADVAAQGADPFVGRFSDGWLELSVAGAGGQYSGQIVVGGQTYPFVAQATAGRLEGLYESGGQRYPFSATLQGDSVTLVNGDQAFRLQRQAAVPGQAAPAAAPQPTPPAAGGYLPPGTRLTYRHAVASNPGTNAGPEARAIGGQGYLEIDIYYSDAQLCVAKVGMYTQGLMVDSLNRTSSEVIVGEGGICGTYWAPPAVLAAYQAPPGGIQTVQRGQFDLAGRRYDALYISNEYQDNRITRVYDLATGIMLTEVEGSGQRGYAAGGNPEAAGSGVQELVSVRQVALPWSQAAPLPAAIQNLQSLSYRGEIVTSTPGIYMWDSSIKTSFEMHLTIQRRAATWLLAESSMSTAMEVGGTAIAQPPIQARAIVNSVSGHFLPPEAIAGLSAGQVIDVDPVTGMRIYVERADQNGVVIVNEGRGNRATSTYDPRTGLMVLGTLEQASDGQNLSLTQRLTDAK